MQITKFVTALSYSSTLMARNSGHGNGARAGFLSNMAAKHSKEMYGRNKTK